MMAAALPYKHKRVLLAMIETLKKHKIYQAALGQETEITEKHPNPFNTLGFAEKYDRKGNMKILKMPITL